ncbi:MAG: thioredoxin family protein [Verrucomicrobiae bacterium]|nr:thioredoxin family protein [Verrucomicrobiae bacterium]
MNTLLKKALWVGLAIVWMSATAHAEWKTDFAAAQAEAKKENRLLVLNFTGSDWCPPCIQMKREVLDKKEFKDFAAKNLVLVEVDFPRRKAISAAQRRANEALQKKFSIEGYPTFIVLGPDGKELSRDLGYVPGGLKGFLTKLEGLKKKNAS